MMKLQPYAAPDSPSDETTRPYCTFRLGQSLFGVDLHDVKEVNGVPHVTPIPHGAASVRGYVNLRGQIHLILDAKLLLGLGSSPLDPETRLILFKSNLGDPFGILVDRLGDIVRLRLDQVEATDSRSSRSELVAGVGKLAGELLIVLDAHKLLPSVERSAADREASNPSRSSNLLTEAAP